MTDPLQPIDPMDESRLVASGAFRVDPARLLDKLQKFQLARPGDFVREWLRAAVLSGATRVGLEIREGALCLRFDGRPLGSRTLEDPFSSLYGEGEERDRFLAMGLLSALKFAPETLTVVAREGARSRVVNLASAPPAQAPAGQDRPGTTVILMRWDEKATGLQADAISLSVLESTAMYPVPLELSGIKLAPFREDQPDGSERIEAQGVAIHCAPCGREGGGVLRLYRQGVLVEAIPNATNGSLVAHCNDDAFALDISHSRVVQDARFLRVRELCARDLSGLRFLVSKPAGLGDGSAMALIGLLFVLFGFFIPSNPNSTDGPLVETIIRGIFVVFGLGFSALVLATAWFKRRDIDSSRWQRPTALGSSLSRSVRRL